MALSINQVKAAKIRELNYLGKEAWFKLTGYKPHDSQLKIHQSVARFKVAICGRRFGKSLLASKEGEYVAMQGNKRGWIVAPTYDLTDKIFREVWKTFIILDKGVMVSSASERERIIKFKNGSEIRGKTAENPTSLIGEGLDWLVIDEAAKIKKSVWERYLRPTITDREGSVLFITTPEGTNWLHDLFLRGANSKHPDWESFHFTTANNPYIKASDIQEAKDTLTDEAFRQEYMAGFTTFTGKVYKDFDIATNVMNGNMPEEFEKVFTGIDFGFINQTAILVIGVKDGRFYIIDEVYKAGMNENDTVLCYEELKRQYPKISGGYGDHDQSKLNTLNRAGLNIKKALKKNVADGIQTVAEQLKPKSDGKPCLFISTQCKNLITEMENYRYADKKNNTNIKEEPIKLNDHAVDALRYGIHTYLKGFKPKTHKGAFL
jgi:PBSX family phage terminase large subunit